MTVSLDNQNVLSFFFSLLKMIRTDILDKFILPGLRVSYWDFLIGLAVVVIVLTVLVNAVRVGSVSYSSKSRSASKRSKGKGE